ncbi:hypothetical protein RHSP_79735 [Rhizobium freirei PRF 81]|uniref:Uncharacterized protein n=1 Tax=Rhizobium freirei PRF 81 TaxID=363754 RepID=N6V446_9HYPH|nr:hypothetical protein [Rhizobium freirei]ENN88630.1 hypothetical protein RHSP_79735 [Rhizobium freirei PRF 81]
MFEYSREPPPKDDVLTIIRDEALAHYNFVGHLNRHAFGTFRDHPPVFRGKSRDMFHHLHSMRDLLQNLMDDPTLDEELCWNQPKPMSTDEVHSLLQTKIGSRPDIRYLQIAVY